LAIHWFMWAWCVGAMVDVQLDDLVVGACDAIPRTRRRRRIVPAAVVDPAGPIGRGVEILQRTDYIERERERRRERDIE